MTAIELARLSRRINEGNLLGNMCLVLRYKATQQSYILHPTLDIVEIMLLFIDPTL